MPGIGVLAGVASRIASYLTSEGDKMKEAYDDKKEKAISKNIDMAKEAGLSTEESPLSGTEVQGEGLQQTDTLSVGKDGKIDFATLNVDDLDTAGIKALQEKIGTAADGEWGPNSQRALNHHYAYSGIEPPNAKKLGSFIESIGGVIKGQPDAYDTIGGKKPAYATNELSSGGDVSPRLVESVTKQFPKLNIPGLRITAGNDAYHNSERYTKAGGNVKSNRGHQAGLGIDFTTDDPEAVRKSLLANGYKYEEQKGKDGKVKYYVYRSPDGSHRILDEYAKPSATATGAHFDYQVYP